MPVELHTSAQWADFIAAGPLSAVYFSTPDCAVCHVLKPRLLKLFSEHFPVLGVATVDCTQAPELAAQQRVFSVPTLLLFIEGRESSRLFRAFSVAEVAQALQRPYAILTGD